MLQSKRRSWINRAIIGGLAAWAIAVISCTTVSRVVVAPPEIAGATFVGSGECATCHDSISKKFSGATHAKLMVEGGNGLEVGCEACHGPGSVHAQAGGGLFSIVNPGRDPDACFQCHLEKRGEFSLPNTHHVLDGKMSCTDCHNVHEGRAAPGTGSPLRGINDSCVSCHIAQRGPYVFEHEAVSRDGCTMCHSPHGSVNARMLKARNQSLCLQCHFQNQTGPNTIEIGGRDHSGFLGRGTCWSAGCHEAVHGSHVNSSLRF
ncbi:MAG TPA: cytochrome c3 family protein [Opitutaceae bacterium]